METIKLKINKPLPGYTVGQEVSIETKGGVIKDRFWRNRLTDSEIDMCVSIVDKEILKPKPAAVQSKTEKGSS